MKKIILSALAIAALQLAQAQQNQAPVQSAQQNQAPTPEQVAARQSTHLQKVLGLSEEQKQKVYQAAFTRSTAIHQLRGKDGGNRRELHADAKPVKQQFVSDVNATLTPEQQQKWEQYRLQQKQEQRRQQMKASNNGTPPANNATPTPTKLEPSDDGLNDK
jgi:hypothetical protein